MADERVLQYLDDSVKALIEFPGAFRGYYNVEQQILRLLEMRQVLLHPEQAHVVGPKVVEDFYAQMDRMYPGGREEPLYVRVKYKMIVWKDFLHNFADEVRSSEPRQTLGETTNESQVRRIQDGTFSGTVDKKRPL